MRNFDRIAGAEKTRNLKLAKTIPYSKTNEQLKEYTFAERLKGKDSVWMLLQAVQQCGLTNDALMEILYEQIADAYPAEHKFAVSTFNTDYVLVKKENEMKALDKLGRSGYKILTGERYGDYFMNRSVTDIMDEYSEQHDEWNVIG